MFYLKIISSKGKRKNVSLKEGRTSIGRSSKNTIAVAERGVSRAHAVIEVKGSSVTLADLNSRNGTFVNRERVKRVSLRIDDEIHIGDALLMLGEAFENGVFVDCGPDTQGEIETEEIALAFSTSRGRVARKKAYSLGHEGAPLLAEIAELAARLRKDRITTALFNDGLRLFLRSIGGERGFLFALSEGRLFLRAAESAGVENNINRALMERALAKKKLLILTGAGVANGRGRGAKEAAGEGPPASIPLLLEDRAVGALYVVLKRNADMLEEASLAPVESLMTIMTLALELDQARQVLGKLDEESSHIDKEIRSVLEKRLYPSAIIAESKAFKDLLRLAKDASGTSFNVLVRGESGTGKEVIARYMHDNSRRAGQQFLAVNCASIPDSLMDAELFGIEKGTATGVEFRQGKLELANGGTLFLDEVGDLSKSAQARLLRVLEEKEFYRVGGTVPVKTDIRIISATNKDLEKLIEAEAFREDLYFRLSRIEIHAPPLRERTEDILPLANYFLEKFRQELHRPAQGFDIKAVEQLLSYSWPGNVRELQNIISRALLTARGPIIEPDDLNVRHQGTGAGDPDLTTLASRPWEEAKRAFEKKYFDACLQRTQGRISEAARRAGIARNNLWKKVKNLHLDIDQARKKKL